jgi:predicted HTH domain antitoxin
MLDNEQCIIIPIKDILNEVITLQEASELLGIADSTLRKKVLNGEFKEWEYRKTTKVILFNKSAILYRRH